MADYAKASKGMNFVNLPISIPSPGPEWQGWHIVIGDFKLTIHTYAICILVGIILATIITSRRLTKRGAEPGIVFDIALWAVPLGIICARLYHVLTHLNDYFGPGKNPWNPLEPGAIWNIWEGGNAIYGSLIGGAIGVWIACRITGLRFLSFADALAPGLLVAQATGRLGNYFNNELFGMPTDLPWGLQIAQSNPAWPAGLPAGTLFHPTFLYEIIWNLAGAALIFLLERRKPRRWGTAFGIYLIWYGLGRSYFETIRVDPSEMLLGIRSNVWASFIAIVIGIVLLILQHRRHPGREASVYQPGREWRPDDLTDDADRTGANGNYLVDVDQVNAAGNNRASADVESQNTDNFDDDVKPGIRVLDAATSTDRA